MKVLACSVDNCGHDAAHDIWVENDSREFLCEHHKYETYANEWVVFQVRGRDLMMDTAASWFYIPEPDLKLKELARKTGLS